MNRGLAILAAGVGATLWLVSSGCAETNVVSIKKNITLQERLDIEEPGEEPPTLEEQIESYVDKLDEHPDNPFVYFRLGQLHEQKNDLVQAIAYLKECLARTPPRSDPRPHYWLGRVYLKQGELGPAVSHFREALTVTQPQGRYYYEMRAYRESYYGLGVAYDLAGNRRKSFDAFRKFMALGGEPERAAQFTRK